MSKVTSKPHQPDNSPVLREFAEQFDRCWLCGTRAINTWPPRLAIHHLVRGVDREKAKHERCVLIRTCQRCHEARLDGMEIALQLAIKKHNDPEHFDRVRVNRLRNRADNAVSEGDVMLSEIELVGRSDETGFPFPRWTW